MKTIYDKKKLDKIRTNDICLGDLIILQNGKIYLATEHYLIHPINNDLSYGYFDYQGRTIWGKTPDRVKPILKIIHKTDKEYDVLFKKYLNAEEIKIEKVLLVEL